LLQNLQTVIGRMHHRQRAHSFGCPIPIWPGKLQPLSRALRGYRGGSGPSKLSLSTTHSVNNHVPASPAGGAAISQESETSRTQGFIRPAGSCWRRIIRVIFYKVSVKQVFWGSNVCNKSIDPKAVWGLSIFTITRITDKSCGSSTRWRHENHQGQYCTSMLRLSKGLIPAQTRENLCSGAK